MKEPFSFVARLVAFCLALLVTPLPAQAAASQPGAWEELEPGLALARFPVPVAGDRAGELLALRIDPARYSFVILSVSIPGEKKRSLRDWAEAHGLLAAINAGMYQPDGRTHTGYLRVGDIVNNAHVAAKFGAFFVTSPDISDQLPDAAVLDRSVSDWQALIPHYEMVVQNFRMISADRRLQWLADGPEHAISAVGEDGNGHILFLHCSDAMTCAAFAKRLLELPLDVRQVMYVEGGNQAGLFLDTGRERHVWAGRHPTGYWPAGGINTPLPNIIGVKRRQ